MADPKVKIRSSDLGRGVPRPDAFFRRAEPVEQGVRRPAPEPPTHTPIAPDTAAWFNSLPQGERRWVNALAGKVGLQRAREMFMSDPLRKQPEVELPEERFSIIQAARRALGVGGE